MSNPPIAVGGHPRVARPARPPRWLVERWEAQHRWLHFTVYGICAAALVLAFTTDAAYFLFGIVAIAIVVLPLEFALACLVLGLLALSLHGGLNRAYVDTLRYVLIFGGSAVLAWKSVRMNVSFPVRSFSIFGVAIASHIAVAGATTVISDAPVLTAGKFILLIVCWATCSLAAGAIVGQYGSQAAQRLSTALALMTAPFLLSSMIVYPLETIPSIGYTYLLSGFRGVAGNPNSLGICAAVVAPLLVAHFTRPKLVWNVPTVARAGLALSCVFLILVSRSRASALALFVSLAIMIILHRRSRLMSYGFIAVYLFVALSFTDPYGAANRVQNWIYKGRDAQGLFSSRSALWNQSRDQFVERPLLGRGYGVTTLLESEVSSVENALTVKVEQGSSFWALLTQTGIIGFLPLAIGLIDLLLRAARFAARVRDPHLSAILAVAAGLFGNSVFEGWGVAPASGLLWVFLLLCALLDNVMIRMRTGPAPLHL